MPTYPCPQVLAGKQRTSETFREHIRGLQRGEFPVIFAISTLLKWHALCVIRVFCLFFFCCEFKFVCSLLKSDDDIFLITQQIALKLTRSKLNEQMFICNL